MVWQGSSSPPSRSISSYRQDWYNSNKWCVNVSITGTGSLLVTNTAAVYVDQAYVSQTAFLSPQDLKSKRNPRLVPYVLLDERTKKSNRDSLREAIRTLIGYGYNIEPSDQEGGESHALSSQHARLQSLPVGLKLGLSLPHPPGQVKRWSGSASTRSASLESRGRTRWKPGNGTLSLRPWLVETCGSVGPDPDVNQTWSSAQMRTPSCLMDTGYIWTASRHLRD